MNSSSSIKLSCIIDDDDVYINLVKKIIDLKQLSEDVLVFKNGQEAIDYFKKAISSLNPAALPEIILLDLNMPVMDGWSFLDEFAKIKPPTTFDPTLYIVSSSIDQNEINKAKEIDMVTDYLVKPVKIAAFESIFKPINNVA